MKADKFHDVSMKDNPRSQKFYQNFCVERCASSHSIGAINYHSHVEETLLAWGKQPTSIKGAPGSQATLRFAGACEAATSRISRKHDVSE